MRSYALHDTVHELLSSFAAKPVGSLLITGRAGSGMSMAISYVIHSMYGGAERPGEVVRLTSYGVDDVRAVIHQISRSRTNTKKPRLIVIDDADNLTIEAQNALLKSLEEPPKNTHFILAIALPDKLLSTIVSRCKLVKLKRPSQEDLKQVFKNFSDAEFDKAYRIADGWPGVMRSILEEDSSEVSVQVQKAKEFLALERNQKVVSIQKIDGQEISLLLAGLARIASASMHAAAEDEKLDAAKKWQDIMKTVIEIERQYTQGLNPKLAGLQLALKV